MEKNCSNCECSFAVTDSLIGKFSELGYTVKCGELVCGFKMIPVSEVKSC